MKTTLSVLPLAAAIFLTACASNPTTVKESASSAPAVAAPKADKSTQESAVTGNVRLGSKFAKLKAGMQMQDVQEVLGRAPDRSHSYESGKRWIPFYFGTDARRLQALYKGEGCLTFSNGNAWGSGGGEVIGIDHDASGACYQP